MSWARSVPKCEDQTEGGIRPVVVRKNGFYIHPLLTSSDWTLFLLLSGTAETYICPETCESSYKSAIGPLIYTFELWIDGAPALASGEEVLQRLDDK
jgi:hypothetical protein